MHNTFAPTNECIYAQCDQYTHRNRSLPNQYTQHTLTMVTATDQYTATALTPVRRDRTNPPPLAPIGHVRQALQSTPTRTPHSNNLKGHDISPGPRDTDNKHPSRIPIQVVLDIRDRALCSKCHGENNDAFHFLYMAHGTEYERFKGYQYCPGCA